MKLCLTVYGLYCVILYNTTHMSHWAVSQTDKFWRSQWYATSRFEKCYEMNLRWMNINGRHLTDFTVKKLLVFVMLLHERKRVHFKSHYSEQAVCHRMVHFFKMANESCPTSQLIFLVCFIKISKHSDYFLYRQL